jgi:alkylation response protein AidB-like acyl-CoA dehydrogenase
VRDYTFLLRDVLQLERYANLPAFADASMDTVEAILEEAGKFTSEVLAPLNSVGDKQGCVWSPDFTVKTPDGFKDAYAKLVEGGWPALGSDPAYGGQGLPHVVNVAFSEMSSAANMAFAMYPGLTHGCYSAIHTGGTQEQKDLYLPKLCSFQWAGTMNLTEPHCGTDLGLLRTKAVPQADGTYRISGQKIWISGGEQDLTENIIHLVLAKLPDAPAGPKGISLFLVPKYMVNADGSLGEHNALSCGSIEHKMGIKASSTCVMNFDGATGYIIDAPNRGLAAMFTMMNYERLGVGIQGLATGERSYQSAIDYARERIQSRAPTGPVAKDKVADPIIVHPDVRRMLLTMKALNEGGRAFSSYVAMQLDTAKFSIDPATRKRAEELVALLTPVAKAFLTDMGLETTIHGQQVFGGHGFIREWGQEQLVRDCRITQIYEGTNGIQALDLVGRKVVGSGGAFYKHFAEEIKAFTDSADGSLSEFTEPLKAAIANLEQMTADLLERAKSNPNEIGAASVEYLQVFGYTAYAYMWALMAKAALGKEAQDDFYASKLGTARFYFARILPRIHSLSASVKAGSESLYLLDAAQF